METSSLGKSGINVTRLCIGTWQASGWATSDSNTFLRTIDFALGEGLNFIDTAEAYGAGHSEQLVGRAIKGKRDSLIIATKFNHTHSPPAKLRKSLISSLRRLGTEYIDLYQQHWPPKKPPLDETLLELEKLKKEGKIRAIGVSNWMEPEWEEVQSHSLIDSLQPCYSLLWRNIEQNVLPMCIKESIAVLPYSPLCQGLLARKMTTTPEDHRKKNVAFQKPLDELYQLLKQLSEKYSRTYAQISLRWLLDQDGVTAPIVGASTPEQMRENLGVFGWELSKEDKDSLSLLTQTFSSELTPHDTLWGWHPKVR